MKTLGDDVYIQRGETWSLDFDVTNEDGDPYQMLKEWTNPYLAITVTAARYEQSGDFRRTYWLDLMQRLVEIEDGTTELSPMKMFTGTEALQLSLFAINEVLATYGTEAGGRIVLDKNSDFDVTNFLFKVDELHDGNWKYKYVKDYEFGKVATLYPIQWPSADHHYDRGMIVVYNNTLYVTDTEFDDANDSHIPGDPMSGTEWILCSGYENTFGQYTVKASNEALTVVGQLSLRPTGSTVNYVYNVTDSVNTNTVYPSQFIISDNQLMSETWEDYSFRVIKQFKTRDWVEQDYLFDMKILAGQSVAEYVHGYLSQDPDIDVPDLPWTDEQLQEQINLISNDEIRIYAQEIYDAGMPLMPDYDTKAIILQPTKLIVSANIQGRY